ncbi:hypothetical protein PWT90_02583 [Aphanocladium album]|nr:hypothetical protein PWT90_02583 [Aphanocladium album]
MAQWASLPWEIQEQILGHLFSISKPTSNNNGGPVGRPLDRRPVCLEYLTTCKTWEQILEPLIYERLYLKPFTFYVLERLTSGHQSLVKYIWLAVELSQFNYCRCIENGSTEPRDEHSTVSATLLDTCLWKLFDLLSKWVDSGLALGYEELETSRPRLDDTGHGWENGERIHAPSIESILSISDVLLSEFGEIVLQPVPAVKKFILRRQTRQQILSATMLPWDPARARTIRESLPSSLKSVTFFEDFNEDFSRSLNSDRFPDLARRPELHRTPSTLLAAAFARRATRLETLSVAYCVDACDFFASSRECTWHTLSSLFLTSWQLVPVTGCVKVNAILTGAANAAQRMPALKTMVIWYGVKGVASEFRYEVVDGLASVQWRGTFCVTLDTDTLEAWAKTALLHTDRDLVARESQFLPSGSMNMLGLGGHVIHPTSLEQIRCETSRYWFK